MAKRPNWLGGLEENEEIRGYYRPMGGSTQQGRLVRMRTDEECPLYAPHFSASGCVDDALTESVWMINFGLAIGTDLQIELVENKDGSATIFSPRDKGYGDEECVDEDIRDRFNRGELDRDCYIRFVVRRKAE